MHRTIPLLALSLSLLAASLHAGSAGVRDGSIAGVVLDEDGAPVPDVFVVAQRTEGDPPLIRTTRTDAQGRYYLPVPTGGYSLGFSRFGFQTRSTEPGEENDQTALGAQVRAFVEPGSTSSIQPLTLRPVPSRSAGDTTLFLSDGVTGDPVPAATVIVGTAVTSQAGADGRYRLRVTPNVDPNTGALGPVPVLIQADGFEPFQGEVVVAPDATQSVSFQLQPRLVILSGQIQLDPTLESTAIEQIQVVVSGVPSEISQGRVLPGGFFEVSVPASSASQTRRFDLNFLLQGTQMTNLPGVIAPRGGSRTIATAVTVEAEKTEVTGSVIASDGSLPQGGRITQAVIVELGIAVPISGGSFSLPQVPVGRALTLQVSVENPTTGRIEVGETSFTAANGGGVFAVPPILTTPLN